MTAPATSRYAPPLILLGTVSLALFTSLAWILPPIVLWLMLRPRSSPAGWSSTLLPLAGGVLVFAMRPFYWDRVDFSLRARWLLALCLAASLYRLLVRHPVPLHWADAFARWPLRRRMIVLFLSAELLFAAAAGVITLRGVKLVGDEPHYLAIAQSIARDHDLNVFNQYQRGGVREFVPDEKLSAHATFGRGYKTMYSIHLPGLAVPLVPFFWFSLPPSLLYFLLRVWLGLFGALLGVILYLFALRLFPASPRLSLGITASYLTAAPAFFFSVHAFPEVQATLSILAGLYVLLYPGASPRRHALLGGFLLALPLFWGVKYALLLYLYAPFFLGRALRGRRWSEAALFLAGPLLVQGLFFRYLYAAYGTLSPSAVYYGLASEERTRAIAATLLDPVTWRLRLETLCDYLLDQRDGLLPYAPMFLFAFPGVLVAWRKRRQYLPHLLLAVPPFLFLLNHAFSTIRAGACPQGRYVLPVLWVFLWFAAVFFQETAAPGWRRGFITSAVLGAAITAYQVCWPFTLYQPTTHDIHQPAGLFFQQLSNVAVSLPSLLPSFLKDLRPWSVADIGWVVFLACFTWLAVRLRPGWRWLAPLSLVAAFIVLALFPRPGLYNPLTVVSPSDPPYRIYHDFLAPRQAEQPAFEMDREGRPWLVETRGPARIVARVENRGNLAVTLGGTSFDRELPPVSVPPGGTVEIPLPPAPVIRLVRHPIVQWRPAVLAGGKASPRLTCRWVVKPD